MSCRKYRVHKGVAAFTVLIVTLWVLWSREKSRLREMALKERSDRFDHVFAALDTKEFNAFLLVLVMTGPKNQDRRDVIRKTWLLESAKLQKELRTSGKPRDLMHLFVLGTAGLGEFELATVKQEQEIHGDMLFLEGFEDAYEKLTEKLGRMLSWVRDHVDFKYVFKGDDDTFARADILVHELKDRYRYHPDQRLYYGYFYGKGQVKKSGPWKETDWHLCDTYLPYARGGGYILSANVVDYVATNFHLFKGYLSEDASLGAWLAPLDVTRVHDKRFNTEYKSRGCANTFVVSHKQSAEDMRSKHESLASTGQLCRKEHSVFPGYEYNWDVPPSQCCTRDKRIP